MGRLCPPLCSRQAANMNHTRGRNEELPHDPNPLVQTVGERVATSLAKAKE